MQLEIRAPQAAQVSPYSHRAGPGEGSISLCPQTCPTRRVSSPIFPRRRLRGNHSPQPLGSKGMAPRSQEPPVRLEPVAFWHRPHSLSPRLPDENLTSRQPPVEDEADCLLRAESGCVYTHAAPTGTQVKVEPSPRNRCNFLSGPPANPWPSSHHPNTRNVQVSTQKSTRVLRLESISLGTEVGSTLPAPTSDLSPRTSQVSPTHLEPAT